MPLVAILYWQDLACGGMQLATTGTYVLRWGTTNRQSSANTNKSLIGPHLSKNIIRTIRATGPQLTLPYPFISNYKLDMYNFNKTDCSQVHQEIITVSPLHVWYAQGKTHISPCHDHTYGVMPKKKKCTRRQ